MLLAGCHFQATINMAIDIKSIGMSRRCTVCGRKIVIERLVELPMSQTCDPDCASARKNNTTRLNAIKLRMLRAEGKLEKPSNHIHNETPYQPDQGRAKEKEGRAYEC